MNILRLRICMKMIWQSYLTTLSLVWVSACNPVRKVSSMWNYSTLKNRFVYFTFLKLSFSSYFFCFLENIIEVSDNQEAKEHSGSEEWVHLHNLGVCCRVRRLGWSTLWILCSGYFRSFHKMCQPHFGQISSIITWMNEDVIAWIIWIEYSVCFA